VGCTLDALNDVRGQIAAHDDALGAARERRNDVLTIAGTFPGALETYRSGSLAAGLMNHPVTDGDCGLVLDRRTYPELGPDGDGDGPMEKVQQVRELLLNHLPSKYPKVTVELMKRGLLIEFREPLDEEQDPTVDLVIALNRKADDALWIPCIDWEDEDAAVLSHHLQMSPRRRDRLASRERRRRHDRLAPPRPPAPPAHHLGCPPLGGVGVGERAHHPLLLAVGAQGHDPRRRHLAVRTL